MPQRSGYDGVFISDVDGLPLIGLTVKVYNSSGTTLSTIYEGKNSSAIKDNPFTTTSANGGLVRFWANPGYYEIEVSDPSENRIGTRRIPFDAVAGDTISGNEGISLDQVPIITESKIGSSAVSSSKLGSEAAILSKVKVRTYQNSASNSSVTVSGVAPGKYLGILLTELNSGVSKDGIVVQSGSATIDPLFGPGAQIDAFILTVTSTAAINWTTEVSNTSCGITLYGIAS